MSHARSPDLRPIWTERNDLLRDERGRYRPELTLAQLETDAAAVRAAVARGEQEWPDPTSPLWAGAGGPCDWRHPDAFVRLDGVRTLGERMHALLTGTFGIPFSRALRETGFQLGQYYQAAMFAHHGRLVYYLDERMVELLLATPRPRMPASALQFPRHGFCLALPPGRFTVQHRSDPAPQDTDGLYVAVNEPSGDVPFARTVSLLLTGRSAHGVPEDDTVYSAGAVLAPDAWVHDAAFQPNTPIVGEMAEAVWRVLVGLVLYLQSEHPFLEHVPPPPVRALAHIRNPAKRRKAEQAAARRSRHGYVLVGRGEGADVAAGAFDAARTGRGWRLTEQMWVSGHWRDVAWGPGHQLRRRQWIRPYPKGEGFAAADALVRQRVRGVDAAVVGSRRLGDD